MGADDSEQAFACSDPAGFGALRLVSSSPSGRICRTGGSSHPPSASKQKRPPIGRPFLFGRTTQIRTGDLYHVKAKRILSATVRHEYTRERSESEALVWGTTGRVWPLIVYRAECPLFPIADVQDWGGIGGAFTSKATILGSELGVIDVRFGAMSGP